MRSIPLLILLGVAPCGGSSGDDGFGANTSGGTDDDPVDTDTPADTGDTPGDTGDTDTNNGTGGEGSEKFDQVSASCSGDNQEYTWLFDAELNSAAVWMTVTFDLNTSGSESHYLDPVDQDQYIWTAEVTELLSNRGCNAEYEFTWTAFGFGDWEETYVSEYSP